MVAIGAANFYIFTLFNKIKSYSLAYSGQCDGGFRSCKIPITFTTDMPGPIYFFIQMNGFSQNVYPVAGSYSIDQLKRINQSDS